MILVDVAWGRSGSANLREITSLTVGGEAATRIRREYNSTKNHNSELWYVALPTNPADGTITPTWSGTSGSSAFSGLSVYRMVGFNMTPADNEVSFTVDPVLPAVNYSAGGVIVGSAQYGQAAAITVTGLDTLGLEAFGGYGAVTQGYDINPAAGSQVITVTHDPNDIEYISRATVFDPL